MKRLLLIALPVLLLTSACGSRGTEPTRQMPSTMNASAPTTTADTVAAPQSPDFKANGYAGVTDATTKTVSLESAAQSDAASQAVERKIIRNADLVLEVDDPAESQRRVAGIADANGGFVVTSEMQQAGGGSQTVTVTLRVPAAQFGAAMDALRNVATRVVSEKVSGQDVTEEYIDLEARIRTKQALEAQFLEIMKQAHTVSDALEVQTEIANVRTEIEQLEGRRRFLENHASLSTITIRLQGPTPVVTATRSGILDAFRYAFGDAIDTANGIITGFIRLLGVLTPVAVLIGVPLWFLLRWLWRRAKQRLGKPQISADEHG